MTTTSALRSPAYFVSTAGRDTWSGTLAQPNADGTDGPFATLTRARDAMRSGGADTTYVRDGTYALNSALQLTSADNNHSFLAYPGETPVISGGERVTGFVAQGDGRFAANLSAASGLDVSVGGTRLRVAQSGNWDPANPYTSGYFWADQAGGGASKRSFTFQDGDLRPGDVQPGTLIQTFDRERLTDDIVAVDHVDFDTHTVYLAADAKYPLRNGSTFRLLNNAAFIHNAGEFGWQASQSALAQGALVVKPTDAAALQRDGAVVARLGTLIAVNGASGLTIQGLTFADTTWNGTAVTLTGANGNRIGNNRFVNVGTALSLAGSSRNLIGGNAFEHLGANGIVLGQGSNDNRVYANTMDHVGDVTKYVAGISGYGISGNIFSYNDIMNSSRDGIAIKNWSVDTKNVDNTVEYNHIARTGLETADAAAISLLGRSNIDTRTVIRGNRIEDAQGVATSESHAWLTGYKGFGIYLDDQTNGVAVQDNVIDNAAWAGVFIHGGDDNRVENNVSVMHDSKQELIRIEWVPLGGDAGTPRNNTVTRNIAYGTQPVDDYWELLSANQPDIANNLIYNTAKAGTNDVSADPLFVDPAQGDWRLQAGSPAFAMGLHDLPWARMGVSGYAGDTSQPAFWVATSTGGTGSGTPTADQAFSASLPAWTDTGVSRTIALTTGSGGSGLQAAVPAGVGFTSSGPAAALGVGDAAAFLMAAIPSATSEPQITGAIQDFTARLGSAASVWVRSVAPTPSGSAAGTPIVVSNTSGGKSALVIDGRGSSRSTLRLDGVSFAAVLGAVQLESGADADQIAGDAEAQSLSAGEGDDTLIGGGGNDTLGGGLDQDSLFGGMGADLMLGGTGNDTLLGGRGYDRIGGDDDDDRIDGGLGNDTILGDAGNDILDGGLDHDSLFGGMGADSLFGNLGNDTLLGGLGHDSLFGGMGADLILGGLGNDILLGGRGYDALDGGAGDDRIDGGLGDDTLTGGTGNDLLSGGEGADRFLFEDSLFGNDVITDFDVGADVIAIPSQALSDQVFSGNWQASFLAVDGSAVLSLAGGSSITLLGIHPSQLAPGNFLLL